ncbi:MAG: site-2 protease family protein [Nanoarchaeota archaeon]|nr:site-2 protease family protein [Nanoarchaeota archaeon]
MVSTFVIYDLAFLVLFTLATVIFLYRKRHNLQRQGLLYLYRTKVGIRFIEWTSRKFPKTLYALQYVVITSGFILMISMTYLLLRFSYIYITSDVIAQTLKVPVIIPLIPYLPEIFNLDFLPPFYFTYWILIIAIIAIPHEFAHGIFARLNRIKIHSTGFGFLGPFLAAFVEQDEKDMEKAKKFPQMAVLAAGTFANVIFTVIFGLLFWLFFSLAFTPAGVIFSSYAAGVVDLSGIEVIDGKTVTSLDDIPNIIDKEKEFVPIEFNDQVFYVPPKQLASAIENKWPQILAVLDSPAFREGLKGAITEIDGQKIMSFDEIRVILDEKSPGDSVNIKTVLTNGETGEYDFELGEYEGKSFLGIGISPPRQGGLLGWTYKFISEIRDPFVYYESSLGDFGFFIYHLLWWTVLISLSVALVNMLPLGIFDGGRFFYLTVWGLTGSKKIGEFAFKASTYIMLLIIAALMVKWLFIFV